MGHDRYALLDIDHGKARVSLKDAVASVTPFKG